MDRVGRIAGDEFIVMCNDVTGIEPVAQRAAELERVISEPIRLSNGRQPALHASIGIAFAAARRRRRRRAAARRGRRHAPGQGARRHRRSRSSTTTCACRPSGAASSSSGCGPRSRTTQIDVHYQPIVAVRRPASSASRRSPASTTRSSVRSRPTEFIRVAEETDLILVARHRGARARRARRPRSGARTIPRPPTSTCR